MNFIDVIKTAYDEVCSTESFVYVRRKSEMFDIRVRPYSAPEMRRKIKYEYCSGYLLTSWEWGLLIHPEDIIADDWYVSKEELK